MKGCPLAVVWPAVFEAGPLRGGVAHPWAPAERKVVMAEVCCGLATWSWVGLGGGIRPGPVIDNDIWCCAQAEQLGLTAYHLPVESPSAWEALVEAAPWAVVGSPPCPPFSVAGAQRRWEDSRSQATLWSMTAAILSGAKVLALEQVPEVCNHWGVLAHLAKAAGWRIQAAPVSSLPFAAAKRDRVVIFGAPATGPGAAWLTAVSRALAKLRNGVGPDPAQEGSVVASWEAPGTDIPRSWWPRLGDVRRAGRHLPCPTTAGTSLRMLAKHVEGSCRFYGVLVETPEGGPRRLSLWEAGAAMGSVPLPWPTGDLDKWWMALGNAVPSAIPGQILQAMQIVGGLQGVGVGLCQAQAGCPEVQPPVGGRGQPLGEAGPGARRSAALGGHAGGVLPHLLLPLRGAGFSGRLGLAALSGARPDEQPTPTGDQPEKAEEQEKEEGKEERVQPQRAGSQ